MSSSVTDLTPSTGVEVTGLSGAQLVDQGVADECLRALDERGVVVYREADLDDPQLVAFSRLLGEVVMLPMGTDRDHPEISKVTRDPTKSELAAYREGTFFWHIDGSTDEVPNKATLLLAKEVSDDGGGDTEFANTYAAYDALPDAEKAELEGLRVKHSFMAAQLLVEPDPSPKERAAWERAPSKEQPLVWTHHSGRKSLLVGSTAGEVIGKSAEDGRALLDRLLEWCTQPQFTLRHQWRQGDLVVWDNTGILHRAQPYSASSARLMHRTTIVGQEAVA